MREVHPPMQTGAALAQAQQQIKQQAAELLRLERAAGMAEELLEVGRALGAERDIMTLERLILRKARELTRADAGSLLLVEEQGGERKLRFSIAQTGPGDDGSIVDALLPLSGKSIAGYAVLAGIPLHIEDAYALPPGVEYSFDSSFDQRTGYRTKSVLCVPIRNYKNEVIGAIQLINRKPEFATVLFSKETTQSIVTPFDDQDQRVATALAAQAGVALENSRLIESIQSLFEHFVHASVTAIEVRDPATQGHSERVAALTVAQAQAVTQLDDEPFRNIAFTPDDLRELRYAALLHDFGKVSVPEYIFAKAKKLPDGKLEAIRGRFFLAMEQIEAACARESFEALRSAPRGANETMFETIDQRCAAAKAELQTLLAGIETANEPAVISAAVDLALKEVMQRHYRLGDRDLPLVEADEFAYLLIPRGSLSDDERLMMQRHVTNSFRFLSAIPWGTTPWPRVAELAYSHHELLDGSGYPRKLGGSEIPPQVRMMTISDIFDALTASDRPYKKAMPVEKALDIMTKEFAASGKIDRNFFDLFIARRLFEVAPAA